MERIINGAGEESSTAQHSTESRARGRLAAGKTPKAELAVGLQPAKHRKQSSRKNGTGEYSSD
jgi:hypothetical protein